MAVLSVGLTRDGTFSEEPAWTITVSIITTTISSFSLSTDQRWSINRCWFQKICQDYWLDAHFYPLTKTLVWPPISPADIQQQGNDIRSKPRASCWGVSCGMWGLPIPIRGYLQWVHLRACQRNLQIGHFELYLVWGGWNVYFSGCYELYRRYSCHDQWL